MAMYQNLEVRVFTPEQTELLLEMFEKAKKKFAALRIIETDVEMLYRVRASYGKFKQVTFEDAIAILFQIEQEGLNKIENNYQI